jgi:hypothetical protein
MTTSKTATLSTAAPEAQPTRPPCVCGCGGTPKGKSARFLPGHDARYHARIKAEALAAFDAERASDNPAAPDRPARAPKSRAVKGDATETLPKDIGVA